ncbi:MAG: DUF4062 domain-containing protein [Chloroflexi bacterium]|nr:DUF4062 domain-containing protein [Chloroflexota bacterium]
MNTKWKTVRVFISSTFHDMQAERDYLVRFVFPRLREQLLPYYIHLIDVDLRWGVTGDQDAIEVCREIIEECHPRFLCVLGGRYGWVPPGQSRSITAEEIYFGVLDRLPTTRGYAYFYFREDASTDAIVENYSGEFRELPETFNQLKLIELKNKITAAGFSPFIYPAQWDNDNKRLTDLAVFGQRVFEDILTSLKSDPELQDRFISEPSIPNDEFAAENSIMGDFATELSDNFVLGSRGTVIEDILAHIRSSTGNGYICISGAPGSGKTALLAYLSQHPSFNADPSIFLISHFIGASSNSTNMRHTLQRICNELKALSPEITDLIPEDPKKLMEAFPAFLKKACLYRKIVIVIDAINQIDPVVNSNGINWLPKVLPKKARIILSCLDNPMLEEFRRLRKPYEIKLQPLLDTDSDTIITKVLDRYKRTMTDEQRFTLRAKTDADTPLYLIVAMEELRSLSVSRKVTVSQDQDRAVLELISQLPSTTLELFAWILDRLEKEEGFRDLSGHLVGQDLVSRFAALLCMSRNGLSQQELTDLLHPFNDQGNLSALIRLLRPYLMHRGELLAFNHSQLHLAIEKKYLNNELDREAVHHSLANYFSHQDFFLESLEAQRLRAEQLPPTPRRINKRKVFELPWQWLSSHQWNEVQKLFTNLHFLEAKTEAGMVFELSNEFQLAIEKIPSETPWRSELELISDAVRENVIFISRHKTTFFQCLWNTCHEFNGSENFRKSAVLESREGNSEELKSPESRVSALMESWRAEKERLLAGFRWIRSLLPLSYQSGSGVVAIFPKLMDVVRKVAWSKDSETIVCMINGRDGSWILQQDAKTGEILSQYEHYTVVNDFSLCPTSGRIAVAYFDNLFLLGPGITDREKVGYWSLTFHEHPDDVAFSSSGKFLGATSYNQVHFWHLGSEEPGETYSYWEAFKGDFFFKGNFVSGSATSFSPTSDLFLAVGGLDGRSLFQWDVENKIQKETINLDYEVTHLVFFPDGERLACVLKDKTIAIYSLKKMQWLIHFPIHATLIRDIAVSPDGHFIASASDDTVRIWDVQSKQEYTCLTGHESDVSCLAFSPCGRYVISGSFDRTIRIWEPERAHARSKMIKKIDNWRAASFSPDGNSISAITDKGELQVLELNSGQFIYCHREPMDKITCAVYEKKNKSRLWFFSEKTGLRIFDPATGAMKKMTKGSQEKITHIDMSRNGNTVLYRTATGTIYRWDQLESHDPQVLGYAYGDLKQLFFSKDETKILAVSQNNLLLWNNTSSKEAKPICITSEDQYADLPEEKYERLPPSHMVCADISSDNRFIVSCTLQQQLELWDAMNGRLIRSFNTTDLGATFIPLSSTGFGIQQILFTPNGSQIVTFGQGITRVWNIASGKNSGDFNGRCDLVELTSLSRHWLAIDKGDEVVIVSGDSWKPAAWFPASFQPVSRPFGGRVWAANHARAYLIRLEGND